MGGEDIIREFEVCGNHVTVHVPAHCAGEGLLDSERYGRCPQQQACNSRNQHADDNGRNEGYALEPSCGQERTDAQSCQHTDRAKPSPSEDLPVVYLHVHDGDGAEVRRLCRELGCRDFALAAILPRCWNDDLTPWECPGLFADDAPFAGKAAKQLRLLKSEIIPRVEEGKPRKPGQRLLAGYSLAGLFATWACFNSAAFGRVASASGSLWYPDFAGYAAANGFARKPACAYFSLGSKEARTPSRLLRNVAQGTRDVVKLFETRGVPTTFEQNPGNHFKEPALRMAKGIAWALGK